MGKVYIFNEVEYNSLNDLGIQYSQDFEVALIDIYANTKKLIKFIKSIDKKLAKEVVSFFTTCKYKNNVLTFLIFNLCEDKRVIINGNSFTFRKFIDVFKTFGEKHKAIYAFLEDSGLSRTFARLDSDSSLARDAYFIERNINDSFVKEYLITYYQYDYVESVHSFISNVFIYNDERFRRSIKVFRNERFQLILSHKVGFKEVFELRNSSMPVFKGVRLLIKEFTEKDLQKLLDDTFYWWLWNNLDKFKYKSEAKKTIAPVVKQIKNMINKYDNEPKFLAYVDICEELYELYIDFANLMHDGLISVKKQFDQEMFSLDHLYCNTYIAIDYMKSNPVKLQKENIENPNNEQNKSLEDLKDDDINPIDLLNEDNEEIEPIVSNKLSTKEIKRQSKRINRLKRFATSSILFLIIFSLIILGLFVLKLWLTDLPQPLSIIEFGIVMFLGFVGLITSVIAKYQINKTSDSLSEIITLGRLEDKNVKLTLVQEKAMIRFKENENNNLIRIKSTHRVITTVMLFIIGYVSTIAAICIFTLMSSKIGFPLNWEVSYLNNNLKFLYPLATSVLAIAYGILRKRKGFKTTLLMIIIAFVVVILLSLVL